MRFHRLRAIPLAAACLCFAVATAAGQVPRDTVDVLYVGNSYVYFNNLPAMVQGISGGLGRTFVRGTAHTHGGGRLQDHIEDGHLPEIFSRGSADGGGWDWIVLQEQSSLGTAYDPATGVLGSPDAFHAAARELVGMIRAGAAQPAFYMTWAKKAFPEQTGRLSQAYRSIGTELKVPVAPVGEAWAEATRLRPDLDLFVSDGSHPNPAGSYLAACVIYATVTGQSPVGAPREIMGGAWAVSGDLPSSQSTVLVSLSPADADFLQGVAWKAVGVPASGVR